MLPREAEAGAGLRARGKVVGAAAAAATAGITSSGTNELDASDRRGWARVDAKYLRFLEVSSSRSISKHPKQSLQVPATPELK